MEYTYKNESLYKLKTMEFKIEPILKYIKIQKFQRRAVLKKIKFCKLN